MRKIAVKISEGIRFHSNEVYSSVSHLKFKELKLVVCKIKVFVTFTEMSNISFKNTARVA